ncbi:hypothetical protein Tco_0539401 [Tanacetum coccineum]
MDKNNNVKGTKMVRVEYNWKPHIRNHCVVFGHNWQQCKKRERTAEEVTKGLKSNTYRNQERSFQHGCGKRMQGYSYNNWQTKMQWNKKKPNMENMGGNGKEKSFEEEFPKLPVKNAKEKSALSIPGNERQKNKFSVFSTWMAFEGNTRDLGSFGEETDKITSLHQIHEEVLFTKHRDGVTGIKRRRRELSSDDVRDLAMTSGRGRLKRI